MKFSGSVTGDVAAVIAEESAAINRDLLSGVQAAASDVQAFVRGQTRAAGLGSGLENAWAKAVYPNATRLFSPAALIYSKATLLHGVFINGALITARTGRYLAIPTREAEALGVATSSVRRDGNATGGIDRRSSQVQQAIDRLGSKNTRTADAGNGRKLIIYTAPQGRGAGVSFKVRGGRGLGIQRGADVVIFILVPQVRLNPRLDFQSVLRQADAILPVRLSEALAT